MRVQRYITYEDFINSIKLKRRLHAGIIEYIATVEIYNKQYTESLSLKFEDIEDISYYDSFASKELEKKLLKKINKG